mmetsp:Transcript_30034/g.70812  ORF Transcript_30034/g.70812 Transcript_30034/m.70812 type:complete len:158 (-) Transcript_30034:1781-2254(-)
MKRHLIIPLQQQQQQLHHHSFLGSNIAILGHCRPLMNNRDGDREAKRQKLDKAQEEQRQQPPPPSLANSKAVQEELHRMDILSSAAVMFSTRDLIPKLFDAKPQQEQRENESRSSSNDALASALQLQQQLQQQQQQQQQGPLTMTTKTSRTFRKANN